MNAHRIKKMVRPLVVALLLVCLVRMFWVGEVRIGADTCPSVLQPDDRVLFNRWAYGLRVKIGDSIVRIAPSMPNKGDYVALRPVVDDGEPLCVGRLMAMPGDTVWMGYGGVVRASRSYAKGCIWPVRVPSCGNVVDITPWNAELYARLIRAYEGEATATVCDTALYIAGHETKKYRFHRDYYWISSCSDTNFFDSRIYGPVPAETLEGQLTFVLFANERRRWMHSIIY